jgi:CRP/FNR family transcriptional regulator, cyclic AMP receptor protein
MRTILIADDNDDSRHVYATLFEVAGYRVLTAADGLCALSLLMAERPDLLLLNLYMPGADGHQVLRELRAHPDTEHIPCLVFTGDARFEQLGKAMRSGADAFMTKPAEPRAVLHFVDELLRAGPSPVK